MKFQECEREIPKEETQNKYGDAARKIEIETIEQHDNFIRIPFSAIPEWIYPREEFVYKVKRKQINDGHTVTGTCIGEKRKLEARLRVQRSQGFANKIRGDRRYNYRV